MTFLRNKITLGKKYRDTVSGYTGIATARYEYLNGCIRYELSGADKDGKPEHFVFDEQQIVAVVAPDVERAPARRTGGPRDNTPVPR